MRELSVALISGFFVINGIDVLFVPPGMKAEVFASLFQALNVFRLHGSEAIFLFDLFFDLTAENAD